jgi:hypothetical protein
MSTMTIVLIIFGVLGLICVGACGVCYYGVMSAGSTLGAAFVAEANMLTIRNHQEVKDELGEPMTVENPTMEQQGDKVIVRFDIKGSKGTGKAVVETIGKDPNNAQPASVKVTLPSGKVVDGANPPPVNIPDSEMPDDGDATLPETPETPEIPETPDSTNM